jgi:hypothetical protein
MYISRSLLALCALGLASISSYATAEDICVGGPKKSWLNPDQVRDIVREMGYDDFVLAFEDNCFEAKIVKDDKSRIEVYMDPVTGKVAKIKKED